jgi:hypothetical protein
MELRAVSAESWLTPLAVLVPIAGTLVLAAWALTIFPPLDLLVIVGGLAMTALVFFALGGFGFCTQRAATIVPMALVPETPGTCET